VVANRNYTVDSQQSTVYGLQPRRVLAVDRGRSSCGAEVAQVELVGSEWGGGWSKARAGGQTRRTRQVGCHRVATFARSVAVASPALRRHARTAVSTGWPRITRGWRRARRASRTPFV